MLALYLAGLDFSISAAVGFISLFGVSVMNGILIMTYYNEVRASGLDPVDAMFHAAEQRMRPMLMTALSACIGLLPAAVSTGIGSQVQRPLATVVVGGMFIGPIILLVVVPALQTLFLGGDDRAPSRAASDTAPAVADAEESGLRIVVHLLAITLIGTWMSLACLAEEAARDGGGSTLPAASPDGSRPPAREDAGGGSKDADAIDTRITVQPRRLGRRDEWGKATPNSGRTLRPSFGRGGLKVPVTLRATPSASLSPTPAASSREVQSGAICQRL